METRDGTVLEVREADNGHFAEIRIVSYGVVDTFGTTFTRATFEESLEESGGSIPAVWSHQKERPIGVVMNLRNSDEALEGTLEFLDFDAVSDSRMAYEAMKKKAIRGMSFGFQRLEDQEDPEHRGAIRITKGKMFEASPVLVNSVPGSRVLSVRSDETRLTRSAADALLESVAAGTISAEDALRLFAERAALLDAEVRAAEARITAAPETDEETREALSRLDHILGRD